MRWSRGTHPALDLLRAFADGTLAAAERDAVARHLVDCGHCAESLRLSGTIIEPTSETPSKAPIDAPIAPTLIERPAPAKPPVIPPTLPVATPAPVAKTLLENAAPARENETIGWADDPGGRTQGEHRPAAPAEDSPPPRELREHPRYRAIRRLGGGGMGDVFLAEHTRMDRRVAIKVINQRLLDQPAALARFFREVKAAARLEHPNIVRAYDADEAGPLHFLVMELVDGEDLAAVVRRRGAMPFDEACRLVRQAALGLQHAHEHGMVHRDIKPHNLMLTADGQIKVLDFGLARFARETEDEQSSDSDSGSDSGIPLAADHVKDGLTATGMMMGTADYIAPEQSLNARDADIRADIYSLGCTLYHLVAGRPPFGGSIQRKIQAHHAEMPARLSSVSRETPEALDRIVEKMMAKRPSDRYQSPADVITALSPFTKPLEFRRAQGLPGGKAPKESKLPATLYEGRIRLETPGEKKPLRFDKPVRRVPVGNGRRGAGFDSFANFAIGLAILGAIVGAIYFGFYWFSPSGRVDVTWNGDAGPIVIETPDGTLVRRVYPGTKSFGLNEGDYLLRWENHDQEWLIRPAAIRMRPNQIVTLHTISAEEVRRRHEADVKAAAEAEAAAKAAAAAAEEEARLKRFWGGIRVAGPIGQQDVFDSHEPGHLTAAAVSADGTRVITCGDRGVVLCRKLSDGAVVWKQTLAKPGDRLSCAATSPDGKWAAVGGDGGSIHLLDEATGRQGQTLAGVSPVLSVCFSSDSRRLLSTDAKAARLWDMFDQKPMRTFTGHDGLVLAGAFSPDDTRILTGSGDGAVRLFDRSDGALLQTMTGHTGPVRGVAISPDGRTALSGGDDGVVRLWKLETGREIAQMRGHRGPVTAVALPAGGALGISTGEDNAVRIWLLPLSRQFVQFDDHLDRIDALSLSRTAPLMVTTSRDRTLRVWRVPTVDPPADHPR